MSDSKLDTAPIGSERPGRRPAAIPPAPAGTERLGERLRSLRLAAGLTQTEVAGDRFSKEYISQIERGKTRPTDESIQWLAARLGVAAAFLRSGVATDLRGRIEARLARAEALSESQRYREGAELFAAVRREIVATGSAELEVRALCGQAWACIQVGDVRAAVDLLQSAREASEGPQFSDLDRADVLFRLGVCRYKLSSIATAAAIFDEALALVATSRAPAAGLRAEILGWRSRCRRLQRDYESAREDAEAALELAQATEERRATADTYLQASLDAERAGHWVAARANAQQARERFRELNAETGVGRLMLNLGGLDLLRGQSREAVARLESSFAVAIAAESRVDAARALGSLAGVHLQLGDYDAADERARRALELLDGSEDLAAEVGQVHLVLGRSLLERGRFDEAEASFAAAGAVFEQIAATERRAEAWVALGDLASRRGDDRKAARLYRNAAEVLQDIRF